MDQYKIGDEVVNFENLFVVKERLWKEYRTAQENLERCENQVANSFAALFQAAKTPATAQSRMEGLMTLSSIANVGENAEPYRDQVEDLKVHLINIERLEKCYHAQAQAAAAGETLKDTKE